MLYAWKSVLLTQEASPGEESIMQISTLGMKVIMTLTAAT